MHELDAFLGQGLVEAALGVAGALLRPGGALVVKLFLADPEVKDPFYPSPHSSYCELL